MSPEDRIARAIRDAQIVLAAYLQPGPQNPEQTINELFDVMDDYPLIEALEEIESRTFDSPKTVPEHVGELVSNRNAVTFSPVHIKEHMDVISKDFKVVGKVDHIDGADVIKLTKNSSPTGAAHHFIPTSWVDHVDQHVHLNKTGREVIAHWVTEPEHFGQHD